LSVAIVSPPVDSHGAPATTESSDDTISTAASLRASDPDSSPSATPAIVNKTSVVKQASNLTACVHGMG
jgi:hypothetical protein